MEHGMGNDRICRRCHRPATTERNIFKYAHESMHWPCFHMEFEHIAMGGTEGTPCEDQYCPLWATTKGA